MANTITTGKNGVSIIFDGATAWDGKTIGIDGILIASLEMKPTATDDVIAVREDGIATGRKIFDVKAADAYDNRIKYFNSDQSFRRYQLYVVGNQVSAGVELIIEYK